MPGFTPVENIGIFQQPKVAFELSHATRRTPGLRHELPLINDGYRHRLHALHRLRAVAKMATAKTLVADIICGPSDVTRPIGLASAYVNAPKSPKSLALNLSESSVEASYWHAASNMEEDALEIGTQAMRLLAKQAVKLNGVDENEDIWTLTLSNDATKEAVCEEIGLQRVNMTPIFIDAEDEVTRVRHLWRAPIGEIIRSTTSA